MLQLPAATDIVTKTAWISGKISPSFVADMFDKHGFLKARIAPSMRTKKFALCYGWVEEASYFIPNRFHWKLRGCIDRYARVSLAGKVTENASNDWVTLVGWK